MTRVVILGSGESGTGTAILAQAKGFDVFVSDKGTITANYKAELDEYNIDYEENGHNETKILNAQLVVKSPGIPNTAPIVVALLQKGISIVSEIDFASQFTQAKLIGITGTDGKTTTSKLTYHILKSAGLNVGLGGNVGHSFARQVALNTADYYVLELSSFQLDDTYNTRFIYSVITNITPDHLDRYNYKLELYAQAKLRITLKQNSNDTLLYNGDDPISSQLILSQSLKCNKVNICPMYMSPWAQFLKQNFKLQGAHNYANAFVAISIAQGIGINEDQIKEALISFNPLEHRMEPAGVIDEVIFINDSKATTVNAATQALSSIAKDIVWIAGGVDKGNDYTALKQIVRNRVRALICLGIDNEKLKTAFSDIIPVVVETQSIKNCIELAIDNSIPGSTVLLSPCCASFDLFKNYEDRGNQFKEAIAQYLAL